MENTQGKQENEEINKEPENKPKEDKNEKSVRSNRLMKCFKSPNGVQTSGFFCAITGIILQGVTMTLVVIYGDKECFSAKYRNYALIGACLIELAVILLLAKFFGIRKELRAGAVKGEINSLFAAFILAVNSYLLPDLVMMSYFPKSNALYILLGILLCFLIYLPGIIFFPKPHAWFTAISGFFTLYALVQFYVNEFRGNPVQFADLANISSAMEINGMYKISFRILPFYAVLNLALTVYVIVTAKFKKPKINTRLFSCGGLVIGMLVMFYGGRFAYDLGIKNRYIRLNFSGAENADTYACVGYDLMFCFDGMFNRVSEPDNYSTQRAENILSGYSAEKADKKPNIIAIMNESFADFQHIASFKTNKDYLPNYHALQKESVSGYVSVSAYGGYSCNSEYEFLSGNTLGFLPSGSAVFTQYLDEKQDSLVSYLNSLGYTTQALSPCSEGLWDIKTAYENLQFTDSVFDCWKYIDCNDTEYVNGNMSDATLYHYVEEQYEKHSDSPYFVWTATMQNHAPYNDPCSVPSEITFKDYNDPEALQYLNSIYQSDKALGELTDYFKDKDEEVIIIMFGDHYPHIIDFTEHLYGQDVATLSVKDYFRLHQTPFIIWSNKGLESEQIDEISLNYLSNELMEAAELPKAPYQQELDKIRKKIPVISSCGYMTDKGEWYSINETADGCEDILNEYETVQYYRMFDKKRHTQ